MTNKQYLIEELTKITLSKNKEIVEKIYNIVNEKDWKDFRSEMSDYDHPEERVRAKKEMQESFNKLLQENPNCSQDIEFIVEVLDNSNVGLGNFYYEYFHNMSEKLSVKVN